MARPVSSESVFRAVAHPTRQRILQLVSKRPRSVADLVAEFDHSQPTLSRHLRILNEAGIIAYRSRGARHVYEPVPGALKALRQWLDGLAALTGQRRAARSR
jgi:DNA-binding transcriptional ArsR family regulator